MAIKDGGISSFTTNGQASSSGSIEGRGVLTATAEGIADGAMNGFMTASRIATADGTAATAITIAAYGNLGVALSIGSQPSANDIAQAVVGGVAIESGLNLRQLMRAISAVLLGESANGNTTFKSADNDTVTRVAGTVDTNGNRTSVTLTLGD
jgi:hypothetical protein